MVLDLIRRKPWMPPAFRESPVGKHCASGYTQYVMLILLRRKHKFTSDHSAYCTVWTNGCPLISQPLHCLIIFFSMLWPTIRRMLTKCAGCSYIRSSVVRYNSNELDNNLSLVCICVSNGLNYEHESNRLRVRMSFTTIRVSNSRLNNWNIGIETHCMKPTDLSGGWRCGKSWPNGEILSSMALACFCW